jgi:predicted ATPase
LTRFIGREGELSAVKALLATHRLVTLTGVGGGGKTRLALQVAADLLSRFADGVWLVDLAPVRDPSLVLPAVATVFGVREGGHHERSEGSRAARPSPSDWVPAGPGAPHHGRPLLTTLTAFLQAKNLLLVLDNFEQVLSAAPQVLELLSAAPQVTVLATSRAPLHLHGEQEVPVPPLEVPDPRRLPPLELLSQFAAVELFRQRARDVQPDFALSGENAAAVAAICERLDGLPLAIELAARRVKLLSPAALLSRLEPRLPLLVGGARDLPARHQTLRATIAWSYDLLSAAEQKLFRRISLFVGGCTLEAAAVVSATPDGQETDLLDRMASLVDKSLLREEEQTDGEPRFLMLETLREYGLECLAASGEGLEIRRRHAESFLALAETAEREMARADQGHWLDRLEREHDILRSDVEWFYLLCVLVLGFGV